VRAGGGSADFVATSLANASAARELARRAVELGGGHVDILVNSAGAFPFGPTAGVDGADFDAIYGLNVKAPFFLVSELAPQMAARGAGSIVSLSTMVAHFGAAGMALYGSTKAALVLLTKEWADEFGPSGVRVNAVSPGPTRTEGTAVMGDGLDQLAQTLPLRRVGRPKEIAAASGCPTSAAGTTPPGATRAAVSRPTRLASRAGSRGAAPRAAGRGCAAGA
jgi:NAD(P)-dependent dehydrogenase (short-subunit alcohol dehydrogenase family)